ncbi:hypothetical protein AB1484_31300 [Parafrankia sp. FMc6]|uniref:hypothetical protein n=1 Tax=Parafrankia soli TaxID=2599596 RepID=UPI0034D66C14
MPHEPAPRQRWVARNLGPAGRGHAWTPLTARARRRARVLLAAAALGLVAVACSGPPTNASQVYSYTDEHGRACTAIVTSEYDEDEGLDVQASEADCEYPPPGREPGPTGFRSLPMQGPSGVD